MARPAFSIRFPEDLAEALDRIAEHREQSRSDLVETLIRALDDEDRDMVLKTTVTGAPTEKLNLRLSADALTRLKQLAGDLEPADFLRRLIACIVAMAPPEWRQRAAAQANRHGPASARAGRRVHTDLADEEGGAAVSAVQAGAASVALLAIFLIGALVTLIVWLIWRGTDPPASEPSNNPGGQLPPGTMRTDRA
jgi:Ribbon-helix-helix protein, copG family